MAVASLVSISGGCFFNLCLVSGVARSSFFCAVAVAAGAAAGVADGAADGATIIDTDGVIVDDAAAGVAAGVAADVADVAADVVADGAADGAAAGLTDGAANGVAASASLVFPGLLSRLYVRSLIYLW